MPQAVSKSYSSSSSTTYRCASTPFTPLLSTLIYGPRHPALGLVYNSLLRAMDPMLLHDTSCDSCYSAGVTIVTELNRWTKYLDPSSLWLEGQRLNWFCRSSHTDLRFAVFEIHNDTKESRKAVFT